MEEETKLDAMEDDAVPDSLIDTLLDEMLLDDSPQTASRRTSTQTFEEWQDVFAKRSGSHTLTNFDPTTDVNMPECNEGADEEAGNSGVAATDAVDISNSNHPTAGVDKNQPETVDLEEATQQTSSERQECRPGMSEKKDNMGENVNPHGQKECTTTDLGRIPNTVPHVGNAPKNGTRRGGNTTVKTRSVSQKGSVSQKENNHHQCHLTTNIRRTSKRKCVEATNHKILVSSKGFYSTTQVQFESALPKHPKKTEQKHPKKTEPPTVSTLPSNTRMGGKRRTVDAYGGRRQTPSKGPKGKNEKVDIGVSAGALSNLVASTNYKQAGESVERKKKGDRDNRWRTKLEVTILKVMREVNAAAASTVTPTATTATTTAATPVATAATTTATTTPVATTPGVTPTATVATTATPVATAGTLTASTAFLDIPIQIPVGDNTTKPLGGFVPLGFICGVIDPPQLDASRRNKITYTKKPYRSNAGGASGSLIQMLYGVQKPGVLRKMFPTIWDLDVTPDGRKNNGSWLTQGPITNDPKLELVDKCQEVIRFAISALKGLQFDESDDRMPTVVDIMKAILVQELATDPEGKSIRVYSSETLTEDEQKEWNKMSNASPLVPYASLKFHYEVDGELQFTRVTTRQQAGQMKEAGHKTVWDMLNSIDQDMTNGNNPLEHHDAEYKRFFTAFGMYWQRALRAHELMSSVPADTEVADREWRHPDAVEYEDADGEFEDGYNSDGSYASDYDFNKHDRWSPVESWPLFKPPINKRTETDMANYVSTTKSLLANDCDYSKRIRAIDERIPPIIAFKIIGLEKTPSILLAMGMNYGSSSYRMIWDLRKSQINLSNHDEFIGNRGFNFKDGPRITDELRSSSRVLFEAAKKSVLDAEQKMMEGCLKADLPVAVSMGRRMDDDFSDLWSDAYLSAHLPEENDEEKKMTPSASVSSRKTRQKHAITERKKQLSERPQAVRETEQKFLEHVDGILNQARDEEKAFIEPKIKVTDNEADPKKRRKELMEADQLQVQFLKHRKLADNLQAVADHHIEHHVRPSFIWEHRTSYMMDHTNCDFSMLDEIIHKPVSILRMRDFPNIKPVDSASLSYDARNANRNLKYIIHKSLMTVAPRYQKLLDSKSKIHLSEDNMELYTGLIRTGRVPVHQAIHVDDGGIYDCKPKGVVTLRNFLKGDHGRLYSRQGLLDLMTAGWVIDTPLVPSGSYIRVAVPVPPDPEKEGDQGKFVMKYIHVQYGEILVRSVYLPHSGSYGHMGESRLHGMYVHKQEHMVNDNGLGYLSYLAHGPAIGGLIGNWKLEWDPSYSEKEKTPDFFKEIDGRFKRSVGVSKQMYNQVWSDIEECGGYMAKNTLKFLSPVYCTSERESVDLLRSPIGASEVMANSSGRQKKRARKRSTTTTNSGRKPNRQRTQAGEPPPNVESVYYDIAEEDQKSAVLKASQDDMEIGYV